MELSIKPSTKSNQVDWQMVRGMMRKAGEKELMYAEFDE